MIATFRVQRPKSGDSESKSSQDVRSGDFCDNGLTLFFHDERLPSVEKFQ